DSAGRPFDSPILGRAPIFALTLDPYYQGKSPFVESPQLQKPGRESESSLPANAKTELDNLSLYMSDGNFLDHPKIKVLLAFVKGSATIGQQVAIAARILRMFPWSFRDGLKHYYTIDIYYLLHKIATAVPWMRIPIQRTLVEHQFGVDDDYFRFQE